MPPLLKEKWARFWNMMRGRASRIALVLVALAQAAVAQERVPVVVELVIALDSSASVNNHEFSLQIEGVAQAFQHPDIIKAIDDLSPLGAAVTVIQWGGPGETRIMVPFTHLKDGRDAKAFGFLTGLSRRWFRASSTSIATAINDGRHMLEANGYEGSRLIIDVSGDGTDNSDISLPQARLDARAALITINGLPIEIDDPTLGSYYRDHVIAGEDSFIEPATDYTDFARAIIQKLLRELRPLGS
jgi:hypothetical protein